MTTPAPNPKPRCKVIVDTWDGTPVEYTVYEGPPRPRTEKELRDAERRRDEYLRAVEITRQLEEEERRKKEQQQKQPPAPNAPPAASA